MNVEGVGEMHGAEVTRVRQDLAHALDRPGFDLGADPAQPLDVTAQRVAIVGLGDMQPAGRGIDARHAGLGDGAPHIVDALRRQRPELLGMIEPDALDNVVGGRAKARQHKACVAA
jgi:hypothetical protein